MTDEEAINNSYQSCSETVDFCHVAYQRSTPPLYPHSSISSHLVVSAGVYSLPCHRACVRVSHGISGF